jgi:hypothetical protein
MIDKVKIAAIWSLSITFYSMRHRNRLAAILQLHCSYRKCWNRYGSGAIWPAQKSRRSTRRKAVNCICARCTYYIVHPWCLLVLYKSVQTPSCKGRVVCVKYESLGQQHVAGCARTNITRWVTCVSMGRAQSVPRTRPGWMHSWGSAGGSCSSMYRCT